MPRSRDISSNDLSVSSFERAVHKRKGFSGGDDDSLPSQIISLWVYLIMSLFAFFGQGAEKSRNERVETQM